MRDSQVYFSCDEGGGGGGERGGVDCQEGVIRIFIKLPPSIAPSVVIIIILIHLNGPCNLSPGKGSLSLPVN